MAATNHTPGYQLNQWVESDPVLREDFNADNLKIDEVLQTKTGLHLGSYTGTVPMGDSGSQDIVLGFRPKFVFVWRPNVVRASGSEHLAEERAVAADGFPYGDVLVITDTGFTVASRMTVDKVHYYPRMNLKDTVFYFAAFH